MVIMNARGRSVGTYRALLHLLHDGYSDQAWMLTRSMFEDLVFGYWVALPANREKAVDLIGTSVEESNERIDDLLRRLQQDGAEALGPTGHASRDWKGRSSLAKGMDRMVKEIEPLWIQCGGTLGELRAQNTVAHWRSNLALHTSGHALMQTLMRGSLKLQHGRVYRYGQTDLDESEMIHCFHLAAARLGWLARLVLIEAGHPLDQLEAAYATVMRAAQELTPSKLRHWGRNDPCWCESGLKFKRCHGG
jgi:hypothetical protein